MINLDYVREILSSAFPFEKGEEVWDWAKSNVRLRGGPYGEVFNADETPWLKEPMRAWKDRSCEQITICCCAQWGKTTIECICAAYALAKDPGAMICCVQTGDEAKNFSTEKLMPVLESVPALQKLLPSDRNKKAKLKIEWPWGSLLIGGANPTFLRGHSTRYMIGDELSQWRAGMLPQFLARGTRFFNRKIMLASTPLRHGDEHHNAFLAGTQEMFHVPCDGCGKLFYPQIREGEGKFLMVWDENDTTRDKKTGLWNVGAAAKTARMKCPLCGHEHFQTPEMWRRMVDGGRYVQTNPAGQMSHRSFKSNAFILPPGAMSWARLVEEYLSALNSVRKGFNVPLKEFINLRLADVWVEEFSGEVGGVFISQYDPKEVWADETHRFMTVDCQHELESFWWCVRAWDQKTGASRRLGFGSATSFEQINRLANEYKVPSHRVGVDCGYEMYRVFEECVRYGWIALRGEDDDGFAVRGTAKKRPYSMPSKGDPRTGRSGAGLQSCVVFRWSNPSIKGLLDRLRGGKMAPWLVATTGDTALDFEYAKQMDSERKEMKRDAKGHEVVYWKKVRRDNHAWDCECMNAMLAMVVGCFHLDGETQP